MPINKAFVRIDCFQGRRRKTYEDEIEKIHLVKSLSCPPAEAAGSDEQLNRARDQLLMQILR